MGTRLVGFALVAAATTACIETTPVSPELNTLVVHAVLDPSVRRQHIVVQTTTGAVAAQRQVTGAVVTIATPDGRTLAAVERRDTTAVVFGYGGRIRSPAVTTIYELDVGAAGLIPGGTYQLRVVAPDGRTVTGRTTIPNTLPSTTPWPTQTIDRDRDTVSVHWSRVAGARGYQIFIQSGVAISSLFATDTAVVLPGSMKLLESGAAVFERRLTNLLVVTAVDENFFDYYHRTVDFATVTGLVMHLEGGIGVFGSVVTIARRTIVVQ